MYAFSTNVLGLYRDANASGEGVEGLIAKDVVSIVPANEPSEPKPSDPGAGEALPLLVWYLGIEP